MLLNNSFENKNRNLFNTSTKINNDSSEDLTKSQSKQEQLIKLDFHQNFQTNINIKKSNFGSKQKNNSFNMKNRKCPAPKRFEENFESNSPYKSRELMISSQQQAERSILSKNLREHHERTANNLNRSGVRTSNIAERYNEK